jgi:hypothetical protein
LPSPVLERGTLFTIKYIMTLRMLTCERGAINSFSQILGNHLDHVVGRHNVKLDSINHDIASASHREPGDARLCGILEQADSVE